MNKLLLYCTLLGTLLILLGAAPAGTVGQTTPPPELTAAEFDKAADGLPYLTKKEHTALFDGVTFAKVEREDKGFQLGKRQNWLSLPEDVKQDGALLRIQWVFPDKQTGKTMHVGSQYVRLSPRTEKLFLDHPLMADQVQLTIIFKQGEKSARMYVQRVVDELVQ